MTSIIDDYERFLTLDPFDAAEDLRNTADPSYFYVLMDRDEPVARVACASRESCPAELRGALPPREYHVFGLRVPTTRGEASAANFLREAFELLPKGDAVYVDAVVNREFDDDPEFRCRMFERAGMELFQEKYGYEWVNDGRLVDVPDRLGFCTIDVIGDDEFLSIIGKSGEGTLDRNDAWYWTQTGEANWGRVFGLFLTDDDRDMWLVGRTHHGEPVGFVAVSAFDTPSPSEWTRVPAATIAMTGVLPAHRGHRYIDDLLLAGTAAAQRNGFASMIDTVDVLNAPMDAAMVRTGHRRDARPWHEWHYRFWL